MGWSGTGRVNSKLYPLTKQRADAIQESMTRQMEIILLNHFDEKLLPLQTDLKIIIAHQELDRYQELVN